MPFEFIDNNTAIDHAARKRIRSHVAMGKNAGRTLVRPSRKKALELGVKATTLIRIPTVVKDAHGLESNEDMIHEIERQIGDGLSVFSLPEQLTPASRDLVRRAVSFMGGPRHAPELSNVLDDPRRPASMWVQFMFLDEAYFHCAVAASVMALNNMLIKQEDPREAMRHLSHTFRLVNERLSGNDAVSDSTLAVVVTMSHYERLQGQFLQGLVHLDGLQRMVEMRGGISQLTKQNPGIAQKIFKADLEYSLHLGSATRFGIEDIILNSTAMFGLPNSLRRQEDERLAKIIDSQFFGQLSTDLQNLLMEIIGLSWLVNDANDGRRTKLNSYKFHDTLLLLGYHLVHTYPLGGPRPTSRLENAVHLGLTAFIMTFLRGLDRRITDILLLSSLARSAAQEDFENEQEIQEVLLWILFIGGTSIFKQHDDKWLILKTSQTMQTLGLYTWEDVGRTLAKFPWVNIVHDKAGQALWHRSTSQDTPPS